MKYLLGDMKVAQVLSKWVTPPYVLDIAQDVADQVISVSNPVYGYLRIIIEKNGGTVSDWKALADAEETASVRAHEERQERAERVRASGIDLSDPLVRKMVDYNHIPEELWTIGGQCFGVTCGACKRPWPCDVRQALRDLES